VREQQRQRQGSSGDTVHRQAAAAADSVRMLARVRVLLVRWEGATRPVCVCDFAHTLCVCVLCLGLVATQRMPFLFLMQAMCCIRSACINSPEGALQHARSGRRGARALGGNTSAMQSLVRALDVEKMLACACVCAVCM
jgi:hypothetical protein